MDEDFKQKFFDFYLDVTLINYKLRTGAKLDKKFEDKYNKLKYIIPVYNRLIAEEKIDLESLLEKNQKEEFSSNAKDLNYKNLNNSDDERVVLSEYSFVNDTVETKKPDDKSDKSDNSDDESIDENGDKQVEELTYQSLALLDEIKENQWILIDDESESESDDDTGSFYSDSDSNSSTEVSIADDPNIKEVKDDDLKNIDLQDLTKYEDKTQVTSHYSDYNPDPWDDSHKENYNSYYLV